MSQAQPRQPLVGSGDSDGVYRRAAKHDRCRYPRRYCPFINAASYNEARCGFPLRTHRHLSNRSCLASFWLSHFFSSFLMSSRPTEDDPVIRCILGAFPVHPLCRLLASEGNLSCYCGKGCCRLDMQTSDCEGLLPRVVLILFLFLRRCELFCSQKRGNQQPSATEKRATIGRVHRPIGMPMD